MNFIFALSQKWKMGPQKEWKIVNEEGRKRPKTNEFGLAERGAHSTESNIYIHFLSMVYRLWCDCGLFTFDEFNEMKRNEITWTFCLLPRLLPIRIRVRCCLFVKIWKSNVKKSCTYARVLLNAIKSIIPNDSLSILFYYLLNSISEFHAVLYWKGIAALALAFHTHHIIFYIRIKSNFHRVWQCPFVCTHKHKGLDITRDDKYSLVKSHVALAR